MVRNLKASIRNYGSLNSRKISSRRSYSSIHSNFIGRSEDDQSNIRNHGLSVFSAAVFVAGELAGSGVLALPKAIVESNGYGLVLLLIFCVNVAYSGSRLGDCWAILEERYPKYREATRNPYPSIAQCAVGKWGSYLVSCCIQLTLFGAGTVYLLLVARTVQSLLSDLLPAQIGGCYWFVIFAALLCVPMWLGSPKDFWLFGIGALITTVLASIMILTMLCIDGMNQTVPATHHSHSLREFFVAFGTILFSYGGASTFPTIQNDMKNRNDFHKSVTSAFIVVLMIYFPLSLVAYIVYGDAVKANVIDSLSNSVPVLPMFARIFIVVHLIFAFIIIINPVSQDLEEIFRIPEKFGFKRCILRTLILCLMVFFGISIPKFENILALVGGSTITLATFVLPPFFYMKLCDQTDERKISTGSRIYLWTLILIGIMGGIASSYSAIETIMSDPLSKPCYWP